MGLNVYEDLGYPDAEAMLLKAELMHQIQETIQGRAMELAQAAIIVGTDEATLNSYLRGGFREASVEILVQYLNRLGQNVEIVVSPRPADQGESARVTVRGPLETSAA